QQYRDVLEREGVTLHLRPSAGALENYKLLSDAHGGVDVALVQGGIAGIDGGAGNVVSLGAMYFEPLWIFHRGDRALDHLGPLRGTMIAVGAEGSGTAVLAMTLLHSYGIAEPPTTVLKIGDRAAANLLLSSGIDAAFFMGDAYSPLIQEMVRAPRVHLLDLRRAQAYTHRHFFLTRLALPQGVFDLAGDLPPTDVAMIGTTANLFVRRDLHPALHYLLLRTAAEVHSKPTLFSGVREFPAPHDPEVPLSEEAMRFYRSGSPLLQRYLPFWAANLVDRLLVLLVPAAVVLLPAMRVLPILYRWRVRSRIYRWYARLKEIELELEERRTTDELQGILKRLDEIEDAVNHIDTPLAYSENLYVFRQHIDLVRLRAQARASPMSPVPFEV
ncbi:MAG TPA: TAXI family TRAP transporter solute-binding subunit, partial [Burkholderiales bacterium]|nr:TAXI family TRAP transporter solute-binding subunit [Burkholderiales bacterium]